MTMRKKLIAVAADLAPVALHLKETRDLLGDHHRWRPPGSEIYFLVCFPPKWRKAQIFLTGLGVHVLPQHTDTATTVGQLAPKPGAAIKPVEPLPAGIVASDTGQQAHDKLFSEYRWPPFFSDPTDD